MVRNRSVHTLGLLGLVSALTLVGACDDEDETTSDDSQDAAMHDHDGHGDHDDASVADEHDGHDADVDDDTDVDEEATDGDEQVADAAVEDDAEDDAATDDASSEGTEPTAFELRFAAIGPEGEVGCTTPITGLGAESASTLHIADLRFFVSDIEFFDADGEPVELSLDFEDNDFQFENDAGYVAMVDLTGTEEGSCVEGVGTEEATADTHPAITGTTLVDNVASISFKVGVPQALMKDIINTNTPESAPSPLHQLQWRWAGGYRHFAFNGKVVDGTDAEGGAFMHIGSGGCTATDGERALETKDTCDRVNTPEVVIADFSLTDDVVAVDIGALIAGLDFIVPVLDSETMEEIGQGPGAACHSGPMQPDCQVIFPNAGLELETGVADSATNTVFHKQ